MARMENPTKRLCEAVRSLTFRREVRVLTTMSCASSSSITPAPATASMRRTPLAIPLSAST
eukprot:1177525-Prorocentrum_minimum.AAC.1